MEFKKNIKQIEASELLKSSARHILLRGGSRSGKTFLLVRAVVLRAGKCQSRHLIIRKHFAHVKQSVWYDTMPKVMAICFPGLSEACRWDKQDWFIRLPNGSEIWFGGLDDKERTDKILGKEYSTIFFNECSEMSYDSIGVAYTRLSEKNALKKKFYYDCNPPKEEHWSHKLFIQKVDPIQEGDVQIPDPSDYVSMKINPRDNAENLDPDYIPKTLERLPPALRLRFLEGEYGSDDRDIIQASWIVPSERRPEGRDVAARFSFCDPAYTEEAQATDHTCESAIVTVSVGYDGIIHDDEVLHGLWSYQKLKDMAKSVWARNCKTPNYYFGIEDVAAQKWLKQDLNREGVGCVLLKPDGDKIRRTISVTDIMEQGKTRVNDASLTRQLLGFPGLKLKDLVDAYVGCLKMAKLYGYFGFKRPDADNKPLTYEDRVHRYMIARRAQIARMKKGMGRDPVLGTQW